MNKATSLTKSFDQSSFGTLAKKYNSKDIENFLTKQESTSNISKQQQAMLDHEQLSSMDEFCKKQFIFFNENDRVKYQIKRSKHLFQEFRNTSSDRSSEKESI